MLISGLSGPRFLTRSFSSVVRLAKGCITNDFTEFSGSCSCTPVVTAIISRRRRHTFFPRSVGQSLGVALQKKNYRWLLM